MKKIKLLRITTVPLSIHKLIGGQPNFMTQNGFEVFLMSSNGPEIEAIKQETGITVKIVSFTRKITPFQDLWALLQTIVYIIRIKPDIVHSHTPKAGLIGMLASKLTRVPIRMHTVAGLPLMEAKGLKRLLLDFIERVTSWAATNVYPNSFTLLNVLSYLRLCPQKKMKVIGNGSSNGVNQDFFSVSNFKNCEFEEVNSRLEIEKRETVFVFVGRIVADKGINELLTAFDLLSKEASNVRLLLVGNQEPSLDPLSSKSLNILENHNKIISTGWQDDVRLYLAISHIFVFPSYREGFPNVVMQAGVMGLPSIVTDINGCNEIIKDNVNGLIIPKKDYISLYEAMKLLHENKKLRNEMALRSRNLITNNYSQGFVWKEIKTEYNRLLNLVSSK
jgi:glycosyltransferase involved in cell wall biosynthesis